MKRYFIVSFKWWYAGTSSGSGDMTISCEGFPGKKDLVAKIKQTVAKKYIWTDLDIMNISILNLIELNEEDYNSWIEN